MKRVESMEEITDDQWTNKDGGDGEESQTLT